MIESIGTRPTWAEVDLESLAHNTRETRRITPRSAMVMAAVKADAYGHGVEACARTFIENGVDRFAVSSADEAFQLRELGFDTPILVLGFTPAYQYERAIREGVTVTLFHDNQVKELSMVTRSVGVNAVFHAKIDTGMARLGYMSVDESVESIVDAAQTEGLRLEGVFSHFAVSDEKDKSYTRKQYEQYAGIVEKIERHIDIPIKHVNNSAAIIDLPEYSLDMVRAGIMLYGYYPSSDVDKTRVELKQVMTLKTKIGYVKNVSKGAGIGYGLTYYTDKESRIATIPVGYADGYSRLLTNKGYVGVRGKKASIVGRVCMDQCMVDVSSVPDVEIGDEVTLMGLPGGVAPDGEKMAEMLGTIANDVICMPSRRIPRVYVRDGKIVSVKNYLA
jgi:alanine racemase